MNRPGKMLRLAMHSLFRKAATVMYPAEKITMPPKFRGKLEFDADKCIGCKICMRDCPSNAIDIVKVADKQFDCVIDYSKCVYCAQCVDSCPKKAIEATGQFELAALTRGPLKVTFHGQPKPAPAPAAATDPGKPAAPAGDTEKKA